MVCSVTVCSGSRREVGKAPCAPSRPRASGGLQPWKRHTKRRLRTCRGSTSGSWRNCGRRRTASWLRRQRPPSQVGVAHPGMGDGLSLSWAQALTLLQGDSWLKEGALWELISPEPVTPVHWRGCPHLVSLFAGASLIADILQGLGPSEPGAAAVSTGPQPAFPPFVFHSSFGS